MQKDILTLRNKAKKCFECPICRRAREKQSGLAYMFTKYIGRKICPNCKAFEQMTGQLAYEPLTQQAQDKVSGTG